MKIQRKESSVYKFRRGKGNQRHNFSEKDNDNYEYMLSKVGNLRKIKIEEK